MGVQTNIVIMVILLLLSIEDIRHKSVRMWEITALLISSVLYLIVFRTLSEEHILITLACTLVSFLLAMLTKGVGTADVLLFLCVSFVKGLGFGLTVYMTASLIMSVINVILIAAGHISVKRKTAFIPYIGICTFGVMLCT